MGFFSKLLSMGSDKDLKRYEKMVGQINAIEPTYKAMSDEELKGQTQLFRDRLAQGETTDDLLVEAFATVREASWRVLGMRHFDVQLIGGMALHEGTIAEMKTGEGKTLVSTLAGYLNALEGKGVHIVTVNDYLAKRDSEWMGQIYTFLGLKVGLLQNGMKLELKRPAYEADVTYGTNAEFGFDYLRDNMVVRPEQRVQRGHGFAIVDEVDSILIDEARTPLIISGQGTKSAGTYKDFARAVRGLERGEEFTRDPLSSEPAPESTGDYVMDEAKHTIAATERGLSKIEQHLGIEDIYADLSGQLVNHLQQALKAEYMFHRDKQYVVQDGEVKIVDEFTGRIMEGRRYSEGLHQAIEAKEGVYVREENQTLATITLQNYFRLYDKLSGMTGTALTEDAEFREIYNLKVQVIPPNRPVQRIDHDDLVYRTIEAKYQAVVEDVIRRHKTGQPVLVGTVSIESSEKLSRLLSKRGIKHEVLNAKHHEREAAIVAQAGRRGAVTIATNMAGRGTDILLGGNPEFLADEYLINDGIDPDEATEQQRATALERAKAVCEEERDDVRLAGGLTVIGTERHESRRIDNQLRGRSGRQGDQGETQFYLSLEDDLMRLFGGDKLDRIGSLMQKAGMTDDMPIQEKMITKAVESAQRKVEGINFGMRKNVLEYDDVMNKQRTVIYEERNRILDGKDLSAHFEEIVDETIHRCVAQFIPVDERGAEKDTQAMQKWLVALTGCEDAPEIDGDSYEDICQQVIEYVQGVYNERVERYGEDIMAQLNTQVMLRVIDTRWMAYLQEMDYLKQGIGLRGFGQRDPLVEYKTEAFSAFKILIATMYEDYLRTVLRVEVKNVPDSAQSALTNARFSGPSEADSAAGMRNAAGAQGADKAATPAPTGKPSTYVKDKDDPFANVGRNDKCPCGSGKKYKNCCGKNK